MIAKICPLLASPLMFVRIAFSFKVRLMSVKVKRVSLAFVFIPTENNMIFLKTQKRDSITLNVLTTYKMTYCIIHWFIMSDVQFSALMIHWNFISSYSVTSNLIYTAKYVCIEEKKIQTKYAKAGTCMLIIFCMREIQSLIEK